MRAEAMTIDDPMRQHVLDMLRRSTERGFEDAVRDFPMDAINRHAPNVAWTPWHLLEHLRVGLWDIVEYIRDGQHVSPKWPEEYWPAKDAQADAAAWNRTVEAFRAD